VVRSAGASKRQPRTGLRAAGEEEDPGVATRRSLKTVDAGAKSENPEAG
jgi:hypothetical protein